MEPVIAIKGLSKTYQTGLQALKTVDLDIKKGEIFALLGPNGAGKTTLISIVCGIVTPSTGRVMIAKALSHEPDILFLDEPTAGVDVELRRDMWNLVRGLRESGVTIILTTHYIEEAEEMADRVGVINKGELILVEEKASLMKKLGKKELTLNLSEVMETIPPALANWDLALRAEGHELVYAFDANAEKTGVPSLLRAMSDAGIGFKDLHTRQSSLEDIFVSLVHEERRGA